MKTTIIFALVSAVLGLAAMGQSGNEEEKTKISIIHCEGNEIQVYDTIVDSSSDFTAEQFLQAKGFEAENVEIIHTLGDHGLVTHSMKPEIWFMNGKVVTENYEGVSDSLSPGENIIKKIVIDGAPDEDGRSKKQIVLINSSRDLIIGDSTLSKRTFQVNTSNLDVDLDSLLQKAKRGHEVSGTSQQIEVKKTINDDGDEETRIWIDGKEVSHEIRGQGENISEFYMREGALKSFEPSDMKISPDAFTTTDLTTIEAPQLAFFNSPNKMTERKAFTLVLVTPLNSKTDLPEEPVDVNSANHQIEDVRFFPNPAEGNFRLRFNVHQAGQTSVRIYTIEGKEVYTEDLGRFSGNYEKDIDISHLGPGTYVLHIVKDKNRVAEKLIVQ